MPTFELEESNYNGPIPEDTKLHAEVVSVATRKKKNGQTGEEYERVNFKFVVADPDSPWHEQTLYGDTPTTFNTHPDCRLRNWSQEIMGVEELPAKFRLDTDVLEGLDCYVIVGAREYEKDGEKKTANWVKDVQRTNSSSTAGPDEEPF